MYLKLSIVTPIPQNPMTRAAAGGENVTGGACRASHKPSGGFLELAAIANP
jgi:hypothetical protein